MKTCTAILLLCVAISCNPAKQLQRNEKRLNEIGQIWAVKNPCVTDTTTVSTHTSDTIINEKIEVDTLPVFVHDTTKLWLPHLPTYRYINTTKTITKYLTDTVVKVVVDTRKQQALQDKLLICENLRVTSVNNNSKNAKIIIGLLIALLAVAFFYIKSSWKKT